MSRIYRNRSEEENIYLTQVRAIFLYKKKKEEYIKSFETTLGKRKFSITKLYKIVSLFHINRSLVDTNLKSTFVRDRETVSIIFLRLVIMSVIE